MGLGWLTLLGLMVRVKLFVYTFLDGIADAIVAYRLFTVHCNISERDAE